MNFQYPFRKADGKQFTDTEEIYKALEGETSGHYLLGNNRFWHGGIHISDKSAPQCVLNEPVRCMADGEVVAYRLNQDYLESTFGDNEKKLKYSNSFCLVRHEYKSAPNPEEGANKGKQNKLTFYSLYMHLLPYARYPLAPEETPKPVVTMNVGDYKAYDKARWVEGAQSYGLIKKGTRLEIIEQASEGVEVYAKGKILAGSVKSGSSTARNAGDEIWFAYKKNDAPYKNSANKAIWTADKIVERLRPNYWQGKVKATAAIKLDLYKDPANPQNGQPAGDKYSTQLNATSIVEFESKEVLTLNLGGKLRRMAKCTLVSGQVAGAGTVPPSFWICVENEADYKVVEWTSLIPSSFDSVETASTGIKAGDPIGYLGLTENLTGEEGGVSSKHQVHVEIFTAEAEVKEFLKNVAGLKTGKQYLYLAKDTKLKVKASATETAPLKTQHAIDLAKAPVIKENNEDWYEVSVVDDNQTLTGLVKKTGAQLITQHDWEKLGFQIVEETNTTADGFLDPDDMPSFFKDLFAKIDKNNDKEVSSDELSEALKNKETRDQWSKLIAYHPTEWKDKSGSAKWSKLDTLLEESPKTLKHEKERIDKYAFWDELSGKGAIGASLVWHFHPVEFVSNALTQSSTKLTLAMLKKVFTTGDSSKLQQLVDELNPRLAEYKLDTPLRLSHFFAQVRIEVGDGYALVESLNYRPEKLARFSYFSSRPEEADLYGYKPGVQSANQVEIANRAYNGVSGVTDLGNGNIASGDGWKYRGRGLKQLTGRYNYTQFTSLYPQIWPGENVDFTNNPDLLEEPKYAARSAVFFWLKNKLYEVADKGDGSEFVNSITAKINLHTDSYGDRRTQFTRIWTNEKIFR
ncbi:chitinase [Pseudomonas cichorii]|nr:chitinase [Pseudomonas cichorii]MBX8518766.1 chitinase [Pseudomonas cichorii]MBX8523886.1 chitinase [Pseudomonas cichorii]MBX8600662.1 chitinase [Pseudomonas cichorii]